MTVRELATVPAELLAVLERIARAEERQADALETIAQRDARPQKKPRPKPIEPSETDIARAKQNARKLGLVVHDQPRKR